MSRIASITAREILDSRGKPTIEVEMRSDKGHFGRAMVPSGASTGAAEALELRDHDSPWYDGQGVQRAVGHIRSTIAPAILGLDPGEQSELDRRICELDGTEQKVRLGGNALLGVSLAAAHLAAASRDIPLFQHFHALLCERQPDAALPRMPHPMTNMISGGLHAGGNLDFQDILVIPTGAPNYRTGLEWIVRVYRRLGRRLHDAGYESHLVGDEGGFGPRLRSNREAVEFVVEAIEAAGLTPGRDMQIAMDVAATHFVQESGYCLRTDAGRILTADDMIGLLAEWVDEFPITSIEDGLAENDWDGWQRLTGRLGDRIQLVGDDLFTTNAARLRRGIELGVANSALIKVNQIGTLSETLDAIQVARSAGYSIVVSARSGETEDTTIADLAVGVAAEQIKIGSIVRSERLAKYNQLLRLEEGFSLPWPAPSR